MKPPLLVVDTEGWLTIFATPIRATGYLEAQDVVNGEYQMFDVTGAEYPLSAENDNAPIEIGPALERLPDFDLVRSVAQTFLDGVPPKRRLHSEMVDLGTPEGLALALAPYAQ
jgi:hypothetical protein